MSIGDYQISYQVSPIILVGGVAGTGMLPIVSVLSSANYSGGALGSSGALDISEFFGQFRVVPGHTLMRNEIAMYPLANQTVAANAVITQPLEVQLEMIVPADGRFTLSRKKTIITALKSTLDEHTAKGGYYNVATPSYIYQGCLLTGLVDESDEDDGSQVQTRWLWSFTQPLLTAAAAAAAQNQAMNKITDQTRNAGDPPGSQPIATGVRQPSSNIAQNVVPSASAPVGSNVAPSSSSGRPSTASVSPIPPGA